MLVEKTCLYLLGNLTVDISLDCLASKMASNRNTLSLAFKNSMNIGVFTWLRTQRMKQAEQLLGTSILSIQRICYEVGYNDSANFSTAFKSFYGVSPLQYRNKMMASKK